MSEDKTKVLGNEEPTEALPNEKAYDTQPILKEILLEMREGFAKVDSRLDAIEKRMYTIERKFDVFSIELTGVKASVLDAQNRLDNLERKAS